MLSAKALATQYPEIVAVLVGRSLVFPIVTKSDFVDQMAAGGEHVLFGGVTYETRFGAGLMPDFLFPLQSHEDLLTKATELIVSRGLAALPLPSEGYDRSRGVR